MTIIAALEKAGSPLTSQAELWVLMEHPSLLVRFAACINPNSPNIKLGMVSDQDADDRIRMTAALTLLERPQESAAIIKKPTPQ